MVHINGKGFPHICYFNGKNFPIDFILSRRDSLRNANNRERGYSPCRGCYALEKREWENSNEKPYFKHFSVNNFLLCNLRCNYCYTLDERYKILPQYAYALFPFFKHMIESGYLYSDASMDWGGGEPTLLQDFDKVAGLFIENGFKQHIFTNATIYSEFIEQGLRNNTISIQASVDSGTRETYKRIKGKNLFDDVWHNLARYAKTGGHVIAKYIVKNDNADINDVTGFVRHCSLHSIPEITLTLDNNEVIKEIVTDSTLSAAVQLIREARYLGIPANPNYEMIGEKYSAVIRRRLEDTNTISAV
ncbi:MAG TPA: radical SAM protein [Desulfatiglandales bacterium]|nr:radical SAM protein [Desulfatiglandales bacterium]